ncbi:MAG: elongation factor 1-beta [Nitrososphaerota archaeon]|nr:elongation factor 1-beta [Nitrososphaerota archaeon]MDG6939380.1 elongation factor 1-beta [Nitrososphaerota archaeon]
MASLVARARVLPADIAVKPEDMLEGLKRSLGSAGRVRSHAVEPIAFGLSALLVDIVIEDAEGVTDRLEEAVKKVEGVGQVDILGVSRASVEL